MVHTWQANHLPKLDVANIDVGDVVLCGAFRSGAPILTELDMERVGFVAPLSSRADVEWLLRGLHLHPHVGHLILFGDDLNVTAEALLALWNNGLGEELNPGIHHAPIDCIDAKLTGLAVSSP